MTDRYILQLEEHIIFKIMKKHNFCEGQIIILNDSIGPH